MASEVATWPDKYGCDGIDLDIEEGAGKHLNRKSWYIFEFFKRLKIKFLVESCYEFKPKFLSDGQNTLYCNNWIVLANIFCMSVFTLHAISSIRDHGSF